jgi:hypothetical protein
MDSRTENSVGSEQTVGVARLKLIAPQHFGKYKTITFARSRHPVKFSYMLRGIVLDRVSSINDLGVIMDEKKTFLEHVRVMFAKAFAMLGLSGDFH